MATTAAKGIDATQVAAALQKHKGVVRAAARELGVDPSTIRHHRDKMTDWATVETPELPSRARNVEEIIAARSEEYNRVAASEFARDCVPVKVKTDLPIGILHFGDPHLDNPGCDIDQIFEHVDLVNKTQGMYAGNVGDTTDNWVGRLRGLYSSSCVSEQEAWRLAQHFVASTRWLYMIGGNHDLWSGEGDPLKWFAQRNGVHYEPHGYRFELQFKNGRKVRINARHDFKGHSQWNPMHGAMKAAQMGWMDHILVCGHKHNTHYSTITALDPASGIDGAMVSHCIRVGGYKKFDDYAKQLGYARRNCSPSVVTVIDPQAKRESQSVTVFLDAYEGAEFLTYKRGKYGA